MNQKPISKKALVQVSKAPQNTHLISYKDMKFLNRFWYKRVLSDFYDLP